MEELPLTPIEEKLLEVIATIEKIDPSLSRLQILRVALYGVGQQIEVVPMYTGNPMYAANLNPARKGLDDLKKEVEQELLHEIEDEITEMAGNRKEASKREQELRKEHEALKQKIENQD